MNQNASFGWVGLVLFALGNFSAFSDGLVYDNTQNSLGEDYGSSNEFGEQVVLGGDAQERALMQFKFEYWFRGATTGNESLQVRIYSPADASGAPGMLLYDSGPVTVFTFGNFTSYMTVDVDGLRVAVPDAITWSVQFHGLQNGQEAGLTQYGSPTVGRCSSNVWERIDGMWIQNTRTGWNAGFGARISATTGATPLSLRIGRTNNLPELMLTGNTGAHCVIDYSELPAVSSSWKPLTNFALPSSPFVFSDFAATNGVRYYRATRSK